MTRRKGCLLLCSFRFWTVENASSHWLHWGLLRTGCLWRSTCYSYIVSYICHHILNISPLLWFVPPIEALDIFWTLQDFDMPPAIAVDKSTPDLHHLVFCMPFAWGAVEERRGPWVVSSYPVYRCSPLPNPSSQGQGWDGCWVLLTATQLMVLRKCYISATQVEDPHSSVVPRTPQHPLTATTQYPERCWKGDTKH